MDVRSREVVGHISGGSCVNSEPVWVSASPGLLQEGCIPVLPLQEVCVWWGVGWGVWGLSALLPNHWKDYDALPHNLVCISKLKYFFTVKPTIYIDTKIKTVFPFFFLKGFLIIKFLPSSKLKMIFSHCYCKHTFESSCLRISHWYLVWVWIFVPCFAKGYLHGSVSQPCVRNYGSKRPSLGARYRCLGELHLCLQLFFLCCNSMAFCLILGLHWALTSTSVIPESPLQSRRLRKELRRTTETIRKQ